MLFQAVRLGSARRGAELFVGFISDGFRHDTETWRGLDPSHGGRHGDSDELFFAFVARQDDAQSRTVVGVEEHAVVSVLDVVLADVHWPMRRICMADLGHDTMQSTAKLHGFRGRMRASGVIDGIPGVIAQQSRATFSFFFDGSRGQLQLRHVAH